MQLYKVMNETNYPEEHTTQLNHTEAVELIARLEEMFPDEQYSIWPEQKAVPAGWYEKGFAGSKDEVTQYIDQHWTDMRPASLRKAMDAVAK